MDKVAIIGSHTTTTLTDCLNLDDYRLLAMLYNRIYKIYYHKE